MSIGILSSCGCVPCGNLIRSVGARLTPGGDTTNMLAWVNAFDLASIPWNTGVGYDFSTAALTSPDTGPYSYGPYYATNGLYTVGYNEDYTGCVVIDSSEGYVTRCQCYLPFPTAYWVIAYGPPVTVDGFTGPCGSGGYYLSRGCIFAEEEPADYPLTIDLPIPDTTLDDTILIYGYNLGIITPGAGFPESGPLAGFFPILPSLSGLNGDNINASGFGPDWASSIAAPCNGPIDDPFTGDPPP